jgi:hypothetical protein
MSTSNDPRGRLSELYSARQTNLMTSAASPGQTFTRRHFYDWSPSPQSEPQDDDVMGGGFANSIDARPAAPDLERASLRVVWPLDLTQIGHVLTEFFGAEVAAGSAPYTHTFNSGTVVVPTTTFERKLGASQFDGAVGAVCRSLQFPIGADRGYTRINADYFAREALEQYGTSVAGSPELPALAARVPRAVGSVKRDGVALGSIISGDVTLTNVLGEDNYHGSKFIDDVQLEGRTVSLNLTGRFKGAALRDLGKIGVGQYLPGTQDIELAWELSANLKLVLTIRNVRFAKVGIGTGGPGRLDVPLRGRAEIGASDPMVTAVLTNAQAAYAS